MTPSSLYQVVFLSQARLELTEAQLLELQHKAARNNGAAGVTGVLLVGGGYYLQLLEGPFEGVAMTLGRIAMDERHEKLTVLLSQSVEERRTAFWNMGVLDARRPVVSLDVLELAQEIYRDAQSGVVPCPAEALMRAFEARLSDAAA